MASVDYIAVERKAKEIYGTQAVYEMCEHWGEQFNERVHKIRCKFHNDNNPSWDWDFDSNSFHCFSGCPSGSPGKNYGIMDFYQDKINGLGLSYWQALEKLCKNADVDFTSRSDKYKTKVNRDFKYPTKDTGDRTSVEEYMAKRKISKETLDYADVCADEKGNVAFNFYDVTNKLIGVKYRIPKKSNVKDMRFFWQKDTSPCHLLYNMNRCNPNNTLYITEGMIDALTLIEVGRTNVVSIPNGIQDYEWLTDHAEWLAQFPKIVLWVDSDEASLTHRDHLLWRLGKHRTSYIETTHRHEYKDKTYGKDANDILIFWGSEIVLEYLDNPIEPEMKGIVNIMQEEEFDFASADGWLTGIKAMDDILQKGLYSSFSIISGITGSGKSTFLNQMMCEWLTAGHSMFVFSGELDNNVLVSWLTLELAGRKNIKYEGTGFRSVIPEAKKLITEWSDNRVVGFDFDELDPTPENLLESIEYSVVKYGTRFIIIDNLMTISFNCREDEILSQQKELCNNLRRLARKYQLAIFLVDHPIKLNVPMMNLHHIRGTGDITNMAHYIFIMHRYTDEQKLNPKELPKNFNPQEFDNVIRLVKHRQTGRVGDVELYYDFTSTRYYNKVEELHRNFGWTELPGGKKFIDTDTDDPNKHGMEKLIQRGIV